ncbi:hypothetical protein FRB94_010332 [Tulasnella sp. JGI-2019a]|nr:hypothetical protein FRB94_010332 [Tulasnella sp. JGI-2019a]KAG8997493.1 hypothetical protein FRB93_014104 [Tulasnella sp. JGI-2019a]KAG9026544.1 hypothetical protein FRB95_008715 [Tulasnella sp. JGI-2019a]
MPQDNPYFQTCWRKALEHQGDLLIDGGALRGNPMHRPSGPNYLYQQIYLPFLITLQLILIVVHRRIL